MFTRKDASAILVKNIINDLPAVFMQRIREDVGTLHIGVCALNMILSRNGELIRTREGMMRAILVSHRRWHLETAQEVHDSTDGRNGAKARIDVSGVIMYRKKRDISNFNGE